MNECLPSSSSSSGILGSFAADLTLRLDFEAGFSVETAACLEDEAARFDDDAADFGGGASGFDVEAAGFGGGAMGGVTGGATGFDFEVCDRGFEVEGLDVDLTAFLEDGTAG